MVYVLNEYKFIIIILSSLKYISYWDALHCLSYSKLLKFYYI
jgi:hypothetical protein